MAIGSVRRRDGRPKPWEARWRDPDGRPRSRSFAKKGDAQRFLATVEADKLRGAYVDPNAGRVTFAAFAQDWLSAQTSDPSTREAMDSRLRNHLLPTLGGYELRAIKPSTVQAWLRSRQQECAPRTVHVLLANLSAILGAAVDDGLIVKNPCASKSVRAPKVEDKRIVPWTREQVAAIIDGHPERYRAAPMPAAGCGLRQGEVFGLDLDAVDFLGRRIIVKQQIKLLRGRMVLAPPKGGRTREVPLPDVVAFALSEHLARYPAQEITLPWRETGGPERTVRLLFTTRERKPINRNHFNGQTWRPAVEAAGIQLSRGETGMHALRHHYASVLLEGGVSIRALAEYLGHADPGFTLRTYTHLMPDSEDRARAVVDAAFATEGATAAASPGPRLAHTTSKSGG